MLLLLRIFLLRDLCTSVVEKPFSYIYDEISYTSKLIKL